MSDQIEIDPVGLEAAAVWSENIANAISAAQATLRQILNTNGTPWGNDSFGGKFADGDRGYLSARDSLLTGMTDMASTFEQIYQGQLDTAQSFAATDEVQARELSAVG